MAYLFMRRMGAMTQFVRMWLGQGRDWRRLRQPERTLSSYVWQEAEGISRDAKIAWCRRAGHKVHNLQHDGVIIELRADTQQAQITGELRRACSHALCYEQPVEVKALD